MLFYKVTPWAHQRQAIERARGKDGFALFFEQGCGKTPTLINILRQRYRVENRTMRTLILCPPIVVTNWQREFLAHSDIPLHELCLLQGSSFKRLKYFDDGRSPGPIVITNYESLLNEKLRKKITDWRPEILVCDESQKLKNSKSKRSVYTQRLAMIARNRYILSGTPITNSLEDIFSQYMVVDRGAAFGKSLLAFRQEYFEDLNRYRPKHVYFPDWVPKEGAGEKIAQVIAPSSMRVTKEECMDLPPLVRQRVEVEMTDAQALAYRSMAKDFIAELSNGHIVSDLELTKALRLQQIVTGFCPNTEGQIHRFETNPRLVALRELLESTGDAKVLVWAVYKPNYGDIKIMLEKEKISFCEVHGEITASRAQYNVDEFQKPNGPRVMIAHPRSAGIGVNLTAAPYSIFYSRSFSLEDDLQAEARNHRGGSEIHKRITRIDIVTPGTIDEVVLQALSKKANVQQSVLNHLKEHQHEY